MKIANVILDWSGIISNDYPVTYATVCHMFRRLRKEPLSPAEFRRNYVLPYMLFWSRYFPQLQQDQCDELFQECISQTPRPTIIPGAKGFLQELQKRHLNLAILSSHPTMRLRQEMEDYGIPDMFLEIAGSVHDKSREIIRLLERNSFRPFETVFIGDMTHDAEAAKIAGVIPIALVMEDIGYQSKEVVLTAVPQVFESFQEVLEFLRP